MFVAIILVCAQAIMQDPRDCTAETANQVVTLAQTFSTEDECINRAAPLERTKLLHEMKPEDLMKIVCEHLSNNK